MEENNQEYNLLYLEDDLVDQIAFKRHFSSKINYHISLTTKVDEAKKILDQNTDIDAVITDHNLPDGEGIELITLFPQLPVIILTGAGDEKIAVDAMKAGAYDYVVKDNQLQYLKKLPLIVKNSVESFRNKKELAIAQKQLKHINNHLEQRIKDRTAVLSQTNTELAKEISLRKKIESALRKSEKDYRGLFDNAHDAIIIFNKNDNKVITANQSAFRLYGYSRDEFIDRPLNDFIDNYHDLPNDFFEKHNKNNRPHTFQATHYHKSRKKLYLEINTSQVSYAGIDAILSINRDITERILAKKALEKERKKNVQALIHGQELERKRLSRDLHDGLGQLLSGAKIYINTILKPANKDKVQSLIFELRSIIDNTINEVKKISQNLMPSVLEDFGLASAFSNIITILNNTSRENIQFYCDQHFPRLQAEDEIGMFRIGQECINNALKHAKSSTITIHLKAEQNILTLTINDDGRGFEYNDKHTNNLRGNGIANIKQRCEMINAHLQIESKPQQGTSVQITKSIQQ